MRTSYYLFRYGEQGNYHYRMEKAATAIEACKLAFGTVYQAPYNGNVVYKNVGTRSPAYISQKIKQVWYSDTGWSVIQ